MFLVNDVNLTEQKHYCCEEDVRVLSDSSKEGDVEIERENYIYVHAQLPQCRRK
jgi:hypothetical protein